MELESEEDMKHTQASSLEKETEIAPASEVGVGSKWALCHSPSKISAMVQNGIHILELHQLLSSMIAMVSNERLEASWCSASQTPVQKQVASQGCFVEAEAFHTTLDELAWESCSHS